MAVDTKKCFYIAVAVIVLIIAYVSPGDNQPKVLLREDLQTFAEVFRTIKSEYVDQVDDKSLLQNAIHGMLDGLDPYSAFLEPEAFDEISNSIEGKFGGLGIEVTIEDGLIKVIAPIDDTPAYKAGLQSGDIITMLDNESVIGMSLKEAVDKMRGKPGTEIRLTILREDEKETELKLIRASIKIISVKGEMLEEGFGYVRITNFQKDSAETLRSKIEKLKQTSDQPLKGLVLDLRNNPGGILSAAVEISDIFLGSGEIVSTHSRKPRSVLSYNAKPDDILDAAPMIVLVNGGSASASEIVAGALQDHERAIILGTRTFGKGSVQTVIPIKDAGALKLTTARYYTPSNRSIHSKGITPDILAEQQVVKDREKMKSVSASNLVGNLKNSTEEDDDQKKDDTASSELLKGDYQLQEALNILKRMNIFKLSVKKEAFLFAVT